MRQTKAWVMEGVTQSHEKIVSVFEPHTEIIRKGKANKPTELGKLVKVQEAEHQIITHYEVYAERAAVKRHFVCKRQTTERGDESSSGTPWFARHRPNIGTSRSHLRSLPWRWCGA